MLALHSMVAALDDLQSQVNNRQDSAFLGIGLIFPLDILLHSCEPNEPGNEGRQGSNQYEYGKSFRIMRAMCSELKRLLTVFQVTESAFNLHSPPVQGAQLFCV